MMEAPLLRRLAWDSEFFGVPIAKTLSLHLQPQEVDPVLAECESAGVKCLYCELHPDELETVACVQQKGFAIVEFRVVFDHDLRRNGSAALPPGVTIDAAPAAEDGKALAAIADAIAPMSRFAVDRRFGPEASRKLYGRWLQNSLDDPSIEVYIARKEQQAVGLVTLQPRGEVMYLVLLGVAPEARGCGIGEALVHRAVQHAQAAGAARLSLVTQARNVGAIRTYERAGFRMAAGTYFFHKWWE